MDVGRRERGQFLVYGWGWERLCRDWGGVAHARRGRSVEERSGGEARYSCVRQGQGVARGGRYGPAVPAPYLAHAAHPCRTPQFDGSTPPSEQPQQQSSSSVLTSSLASSHSTTSTSPPPSSPATTGTGRCVPLPARQIISYQPCFLPVWLRSLGQQQRRRLRRSLQKAAAQHQPLYLVRNSSRLLRQPLRPFPPRQSPLGFHSSPRQSGRVRAGS